MSSSILIYWGPVRCFLPARISFGSAVVLAAVALTAVSARAQNPSQDVAEAARQEKARKAAASSQRQSHIYSDDDLQKAQIVSPEFGAGVEARAKDSGVVPQAVSATQAPVASGGEDVAGTESLGEVARRYRREKAARQVEQAGKLPVASPFRMELPQPSLAEIAPRHVVVQPPGAVAAKHGNVDGHNAGVKRDPFSRQSLVRSEVRNEEPKMVAPKMEVPRREALKPSLAVNPRVVGSGAPAKAFVAQRPAQALPVVAAGAAGVVTVQAGDSLWSLSRRYSGRGARWREWVASNPALESVGRLRVGTTLRLPKSEQPLRVGTDSGDAAQTIAVRNGDSLWKISVDRFGNGAHWRCIARANPELRDERMIYPGQMLRLPAACGENSPLGVIAN
jgi:nucleoid-associated protein YgaU